MSLEHIKANYNVSNIVLIIANNEPNFLPNEMQKKKKKRIKIAKILRISKVWRVL